MLSVNAVRKLRDSLQQSIFCCDEIISHKCYEKMFTSVNDFKLAETCCKIVPEEYFKLRVFDFEVCLKYHIGIKKYYVTIDTENYTFLNSLNTDLIFDKSNCSKIEEKRFFFNKDINFDIAKKYFLEFCEMCITSVLGKFYGLY